MEILMNEEQTRDLLRHNISQPDDILRRFVGEGLWAELTGPRVAGARKPSASVAEKTKWRANVAIFFEKPENVAKLLAYLRPHKNEERPRENPRKNHQKKPKRAA